MPKWIKIAGLLCFALLVFAVVLLIKSPATNYEASIYIATPQTVWIILVSSLICGFGIVAHQVYTRGYETRKLWVIGVTLIAISSLICFSVHILRGYILLGGDITTHLAFIQNIIKYGEVDSTNPYPLLHLSIAFINKITGIAPMKLLLYTPIPFYALFMYSFYLMSKSVFHEGGRVILVTSIGVFTPVYLSFFYTTPFSISLLLTPLIIYLFVKSITTDNYRKFMYFAAALASVLLLEYLHPITVVFTIIVLSVVGICIAISNHIRGISKLKIGTYAVYLVIILSLALWSSARLAHFGLNFPPAEPNVEVSSTPQTQYLITEAQPTVIPPYTSYILSSINLMEDNGYSFIPFFIKRYAMPILYTILAAIALPIVIRRRDTILIGLYLAMLALFTVALLSAITQYGGYLSRIQQYIIIILPVFVGSFAYDMLRGIKHSTWRKLGSTIIAAAFIICLTNSVFTAYGSRYTLAVNDQITSQELEGMQWFIENKKSDVSTLTLSFQAYRLKFLYLSYNGAQVREDIPGWPPIPSPPYHFGYNKYETLGEAVDQDYYMVLNQQDRILYTDIWPEMASKRFTPEDFARLETDPSLGKVYSNKGVDIWYIHKETAQ